MPWEHGRLLFRRRLMAMDRAAFRPAAAVPGLDVRVAGPDDLPTALHIDSTAFGLDRDENRRWLEPLLSAERVEFALAVARRRAGGDRLRAALRRGGGADAPTWPAWRCCPRRGGAGSARASPRGCSSAAFERGAELAHLNPDTDAAARIYERLGFTELPGHDIYIEL